MLTRRTAALVVLTIAVTAWLVSLALGSTRHHRRGTSGGPEATAASLSASDEPSEQRINCPAPALGGQLPAMVFLPNGYSSSHARYPVIYFLHGLPADPQTYTQYAFVGAAVDSGLHRAIVVAPQGARTVNADQEYLNWSATDDWPKAITQELVSCMQSRYRTVDSRWGRALVGISAGGYGAFDIGLRALSTYAAVESWSGYFAATNPSGSQVLKLPTPAAQAAATVLSGRPLAAELKRWPSLIAFYVGAQDDRFADDNAAFNRQLTAEHIPHVYDSYYGAHTVTLWERHVDAWLNMALVYLSTHRVVAP